MSKATAKVSEEKVVSNQGIATKIISVEPTSLLLLEKNARYMRHEQFVRLVENVKRDGKLTSVPFGCIEPDGQYRVLSGNHRVMAAIEAGLPVIDIMVTDDILDEGQRLGIQLSHNAIAGDDDPSVLKALYEDIADIDWRIYAGLDDKMLDLLGEVKVGSISEANLDYQTLAMVFLPTEIERAAASIEDALLLTRQAKVRWLSRFDDHSRMLDALAITSQSHNVSNVATGIGLILDMFERHIDELTDGWWDDIEDEKRHSGWVPIATITGLNMPSEAAGVVRKAVKRLTDANVCKFPWQALEMICADFLAGPEV
jgi:hypothetical protein